MTRCTKGFLFVILAVLLLGMMAAPALAASATDSSSDQVSSGVSSVSNPTKDSSLKGQVLYNGELLDRREIGPGLPPKGWKKNANLADITSESDALLPSAQVPALDWAYGCSATSAAMLFGYYDRAGYPNMYTGPTNGGVFPLDNSVWPTYTNGHECPLSASHQGVDGRTTKGHVDDYWYGYGSSLDPYYGAWAEHTARGGTADYMGTSQYHNWGNSDGSTTFYYYPLGAPLYDYTGAESSGSRDGTHGMKLFVESRGYTVTTNYNQYIYGLNGNTQGFTWAQYKAEIDNGYPVLIHLDGHTMVGVGYSGTSTMYIHDTWDYSTHTMTWGGSYGGMDHLGVSVIHLTPVAGPTISTITPSSGSTAGNTAITIKGTNFISGGQFNVQIAGKNATSIVRVDATTITARTPAVTTAGARNVVVTNNNGQKATKAGGFTYLAPPKITTVTPASGPMSGNTLVTIRGTNFVSGGKFNVQIASKNATNIVRVNATTITARTPSVNTAGARNVVVTINNGLTATKTGGFTYIAAPKITSVTPSTGPKAGNTAVTIRGQNFVAGGKFNVQIAGKNAISIVRVNATAITLRTPSVNTAGTRYLVITNNDGQKVTKTNGFTYT